MSKERVYGFSLMYLPERTSTGGYYGFDTDGTKVESMHTNARWTVNLPHQCDDWEIVGRRETGWSETKRAAIDDLSKFIGEASEALVALMDAPDKPEGTWFWP